MDLIILSCSPMREVNKERSVETFPVTRAKDLLSNSLDVSLKVTAVTEREESSSLDECYS